MHALLPAPAHCEQLPEEWLEDFQQRHGRPPRVLHIGNIANNAYLNAKLLRKAGLDCDVVCYDYYHIMGCPEWEDSDFDGDYLDDFFPAWERVKLNQFRRPRWFVQGRLHTCIWYLIAAREERKWSARLLWLRLNAERRFTCWAGRHPRVRPLLRTLAVARRSCGMLAPSRLPHLVFGLAYCAGGVARHAASRLRRRVGNRIETWLPNSKLGRLVWRGARACFSGLTGVLSRRTRSPARRAGLRPASRLGRFSSWVADHAGGLAARAAKTFQLSAGEAKPSVDSRWFDKRVATLIDRFTNAFPSRDDRLTRKDLEPYRWVIDDWTSLLDLYDVIVGYATEPLLPLLAGKRPYLAFEHGTLRNIPFKPTAQGRLCALSYRLASTSLITNCDNQQSAERLRLPDYRFVPHPVNEGTVPRAAAAEIRNSLEEAHGCDFVIFHPSRQHWEPDVRHADWEKGNDIFFRGLAEFVQEVDPRALCICVAWGRTLQQSHELLEELRISDRVTWIAPQSCRAMVRYIAASDLVADQFFLGAFGSTLPKALCYGCPSMAYVDPHLHEWAFPEPPPVLNARTPEEVSSELEDLYLSSEKRDYLVQAGRNWYQKYHSNEVIAGRFIETIRDAVDAICTPQPIPQ